MITYRFKDMNALADYMVTLANRLRESAALTNKSKRDMLVQRAADHESLADLVRNTLLDRDVFPEGKTDEH